VVWMIRGVVTYSHFCMVSFLSGLASNLKSNVMKGTAIALWVPLSQDYLA
jgi:hypothetical protein